MRISQQSQFQLDCSPISQIDLNSNCRHRIVPILRALQHLHCQHEVLSEILDLIQSDVLGDAQHNQGRKGMTYWQILVLAAAKAGCNFTYDELHDLAENHIKLRAMMQVGLWDEESFSWKRIQANLSRLRPETIERINHLIVGEGHRLEPTAAERVRGDSFVCETNIHYPTESSLIVDGLKKILRLAPQLGLLIGFTGWRQSQSLLQKAKQANRELARLKKGRNYQQRLQSGYQKLFHITDNVLPRLQEMLDFVLDWQSTEQLGLLPDQVLELRQQLIYWHAVTQHVVNTAWRRVMEGEQVPNDQKLLSLFEPDAELLRRGKPAKPNQFGHQVLVIEDAVGFICHYQVLGRDEDDQDVLIDAMTVLQDRLDHRIRYGSFDRGFHSPDNQRELAKLLDYPCLPKPGKVQGAKQEQEATVEFRGSRQRHPGIESAIGALQSGNGLARCRDHSSEGYDRYVGLGVLGRNLAVLGKLLLQQEAPTCNAAASHRRAA